MIIKKPIVMGIVFLLLLGLNLTTIVFSNPVIVDGTWFDPLDGISSTGISEIDSIDFSNGILKLEKGIHVYSYDFADDNNHSAWDAKASSIFSADPDLMRMRNFVGQGLVDTDGVEHRDSEVLRTESWSFGLFNFTFFPLHHFRFEVGKYGQYLDDFEFAWYGNYSSDANIESVELYAWDYSALLGIGIWENLGNVIYDTSIGSNPTGDINIFNSNGAYISNDGFMDFLIVGVPDIGGTPAILDTDYVEVSITTLDCYAKDGYVVSKSINKTSPGRWESLVWDGSRTSSSSSLEIQVLDSGDNVIKQGIKTSPADLSLLPKSYDTIKIKAVFSAYDLSVTPWLSNWGVTWQTKDTRFYDDFGSSLRIDQASGVTISVSQVSVDSGESDWEILGKNPENMRSYEGYGPSNSSVHRFTEGTSVGGGLRSPILSDGFIYVASSLDNKIHKFDADDLSAVAQSSELSSVVEASVAVSDDYVIAATSGINQSNTIYGLYKSNLTEKWEYTYDGNICFSSAPTISDDKVFITSWNGMGWDMPLLSILYQLQLVTGNNKIIALNLDDGTEIWNASLPSSSFSTPAVADGMVIVGCDNILGSSLLAFDEETGVKIWDISVGLIGGGSPVVYDDKVFVVVKDQSIIGNVKVVAVDQYNGTLLWSTTIAKMIPTFESLPKALQLYNVITVATPAIYDATLFATSPDGNLYALKTVDGSQIWNVTLPSGIYRLLPLYPCTSPVATTDKVYAASGNGVLHAVSMDGKKLWDFKCTTNASEVLDTNYILASPIVANGVLYVSVTEEPVNLSGRIYSIGNETTQRAGKVISNPIYVPQVKWWGTFETDTTDTGNITFSILDEHYNILIDDVEHGDDISNSSVIDTNVIRLCAKLSKDGSEDPKIDNWGIIWKSNMQPLFDADSFTPNKDGWINTNTPVCSIETYDQMPGLDVDSAIYCISYLSDDGEELMSDWVPANCSGTKGTKVNQTIVANISALNLSEDIADLRGLFISIRDLAAYEGKHYIELKTDMLKPISSIGYANNFSEKYNEAVQIRANTSDTGDAGNRSGVDSATLYYRMSSNDEWTKYETVENEPYEWSFILDGNSKSGNYKFCTIATDVAGNVEDFPSEGDVSFLFDIQDPEAPTFGNDIYYRFNELPEFSNERLIKFSDDYELETVEYRLSFEGIDDWTTIKTDIDSKTYNNKWELTQHQWDLMEEDEEYYVYFKLTDFCGNEYITPKSEALTIVKDFTVSKPCLDLSDFEEWHWNDQFTITTTIGDDSDITSVELYYRYSSNDKDWTGWEKYGSTRTDEPFKWTFNADEGSGYYEFKTRASDTAGNVGESPEQKLEVTLFPSIQIAVVCLLIVVLLFVARFIFKKMKRE